MKTATFLPIFLACALISQALPLYSDDAGPESLFGKYSKLKTSFSCGKKESSLQTDYYRFSYRDSGRLKKGKRCGKTGAPEGYYVHYNGEYYVWGELNKKFDVMKAASLNGKYSKLLMKIKRPGDRKFYKEFVEYGYQPYGLRLGKWAPEGFYVYLYPNWYIWGNIREPEDIPENAYRHSKYTYQYSGLIQYIRCPRDRENYGDHYEYGWYDAAVNHPYCGAYSRPGHWVYSYPFWYIWKNRKKTEDYGEAGSDSGRYQGK
ncbi:MAG TPA: hypothetical protein PK358_18160 [Spirochaetota bacterium]|nr:hypothetical protein [Spirochaetota bacterium]HPJ36767.1 hypothetical protein [Spirochaetota bacterium]